MAIDLTLAPLPAPTVSPLPPQAQPSASLDPFQARAASGQMPLNELMDAAQAAQSRGDAPAAVALYATWLAHTESPLKQVACFNHGTLLASLGRDAEAETAYRQALALHPGFAQARLNLGHALERRGDSEGALAEWRAVLSLAPAQHPDHQALHLHALNNLARLSEQLRRYDEAEAWMAASLKVKPEQFDVLQHYVHIRQKQCEWPVYQPVGEVTPNQLLVGTSPLAMLSASDDPALQLMAAQRFVHERVVRPTAPPLHLSGPRREGKLRVGYLSGDLCMHAVGLLTAELFELHDRQRVDLHAFCWSREDGSPLRRRILDAFGPGLHRIGGLDDLTAARLIAGMGVDVLVDLQGLTNGARPNILAWKPAPVQISYLGFPGTCALPGVDWIVADRFVMPEALQPYCTERPLYLPHCYQVSDRQREVAPRPERASYGLPEQAFVFASFNNTFKFSEPVFDSWMRILNAVPGSVLWLLADNDWARHNMQARAAARGVAAERLIFAPRVSPAEYLARFQLADLMLDTFPYNAGTTASDALWMGLPIVTWSGRSYISRMAGSLLTAVGLPELVTDSLADYERLAIQLGRQPARIASYKRYLAEQGRQSPLFDLPRLVKDLEDGFERLGLAHRPAA